MSNNIPPTRQRPWRPFILIALVIMLLFFSFLGWLRFGLAMQNRAFYDQIARTSLSLYLEISGFLWAGASLMAALGDWFRKRWALWLTAACTIIFTIWFWLERLLFSKTITVRTNWIFDAIFNVILLVFIISTVIAVYPYHEKKLIAGGKNE
jgi:hypothetical protein